MGKKNVHQTYQDIIAEVERLRNIAEEEFQEHMHRGIEYNENVMPAAKAYNAKLQEMYAYEKIHHRVLFGG